MDKYDLPEDVKDEVYSFQENRYKLRISHKRKEVHRVFIYRVDRFVATRDEVCRLAVKGIVPDYKYVKVCYSAPNLLNKKPGINMLKHNSFFTKEHRFSGTE